MCEMTFRRNLVDVERSGRVSYCVREKIVSVNSTMICVELVAMGRLSKSTGIRGINC